MFPRLYLSSNTALKALYKQLHIYNCVKLKLTMYSNQHFHHRIIPRLFAIRKSYREDHLEVELLKKKLFKHLLENILTTAKSLKSVRRKKSKKSVKKVFQKS